MDNNQARIFLSAVRSIDNSLERIATALEKANELDPMRVIADALAEESGETNSIVQSEVGEVSPAEFVARM